MLFTLLPASFVEASEPYNGTIRVRNYGRVIEESFTGEDGREHTTAYYDTGSFVERNETDNLLTEFYGMTYDKKTSTITMNNVTEQDIHLEIRPYGKTIANPVVRIRLIGDNYLRHICAQNVTLVFKGSGTLTVAENEITEEQLNDGMDWYRPRSTSAIELLNMKKRNIKVQGKAVVKLKKPMSSDDGKYVISVDGTKYSKLTDLFKCKMSPKPEGEIVSPAGGRGEMRVTNNSLTLKAKK